jgi:hypothetical protein
MPQTLRHSVLAFLSRLGRESTLFEYQYKSLEGQQMELHNWRQRITGIQGIHADPAFVKELNTVVTLDDIAETLNVDGGGSVRVKLGHANRTEVVDVSFATAGQSAPEFYAHALVSGVVYRDAMGRIVAPGRAGGEGITEWRVQDRSVLRSERIEKLQGICGTWECGEGTAEIPFVTQLRETLMTSLQQSFIDAQEAWNAVSSSAEKYDEMKSWMERIFTGVRVLLDDLQTWDEASVEDSRGLDCMICQLHQVLATHSGCRNAEDAGTKDFLALQSQTMVPEHVRAFLHMLVTERMRPDVIAAVNPTLPGLDKSVECTVKNRR